MYRWSVKNNDSKIINNNKQNESLSNNVNSALISELCDYMKNKE